MKNPEGKGWVRRLYDWVLHWAETPQGPWALGILAFAESDSHTLNLDGSQVFGGRAEAIHAESWYTVGVGTSLLDGGVGGGGTYRCVASYDANYAPLDGSCQ